MTDHRGKSASDRTALYRLYDAAGHLLYVGISKFPKFRFTEHAGDKNWWHLVAEKVIEWRDSREEALRAESEAIVKERPLYNGYHQLGGPDWPEKARRYDDTEGKERVRAGLRAALARGDYKPGTVLKGSHVGRDFGASATTCQAVLHEFVKEGTLARWDRWFRVPWPELTEL